MGRQLAVIRECNFSLRFFQLLSMGLPVTLHGPWNSPSLLPSSWAEVGPSSPHGCPPRMHTESGPLFLFCQTCHQGGPSDIRPCFSGPLPIEEDFPGGVSGKAPAYQCR